MWHTCTPRRDGLSLSLHGTHTCTSVCAWDPVHVWHVLHTPSPCRVRSVQSVTHVQSVARTGVQVCVPCMRAENYVRKPLSGVT